MRRVALPPADLSLRGTLFHALALRESVRRFSASPLSLPEFSALCWATAGARSFSAGSSFRTAPSAGALYPIETYIAARRVEGLEPGLYHYFPLAHELEELEEGDLGPHLCAAALDQRMVLSAAAVFVFSAVFGRSTWKYGDRAFRYIYLDAGHMAQNLALAAASLGLGSCALGAIYDEEADAILNLDGETESVIYMTVAGRILSALDAGQGRGE